VSILSIATARSVSHFGYTCEHCRFSLWHPLVSLGVSTLGFYDDARFPGRCILVLNEHLEDFAEMPPALTNLFAADVQHAGRTLKRVTGAVRVNYAILGNKERHVHAHLIPRPPGDPVPTRAPWEHPAPQSSLKPEELDRLKAAIRQALGA
jgi:diadenosine tetraphosphate (Ap4A) HIT family hydrolase